MSNESAQHGGCTGSEVRGAEPMMRLRHMVRLGPSPVEARALSPMDEVTFAPMDALADGLGGLDTSQTKPLNEVMNGSYNYFSEGDLLLAKVTPCFENGKKAIGERLSNGVGFATSEVHVIRPDYKKIDVQFLRFLLCSEDFRAEGMKSMTGAGGLRRVSENGVLNYCPKITDPDTQKIIADFLNHETAHIDQLIEKKKELISVAAKRIESLVDKAISDRNVPRIRLEHIARRVQRHARLSEHGELVRLGIYNRGRGIFKKPAADEEDMGVSNFYFIKAGDLILSGQFSWEGAVALASEDEEGCVVSHRYPVFLGRPGVNTAYLFGFFRSGFGDFLLNEASRGSAGRNRPLNTWRLGKEKIPLPNDDLQRAIEQAIFFERELKRKTSTSLTLYSEYRFALITAAVTGQIDIATWNNRGQTDRNLDAIEQATQA